MSIECFNLNTAQQTITIRFADKLTRNLSVEFLRVFSPTAQAEKKKSIAAISNKSKVKLTTIESVAKHGYRFIFDDQHNAVFSPSYLRDLCLNNAAYWQQYLDELQQAGANNQPSIEIKQL